MRVLLVEDDQNTARVVEMALNAEGFNVYVTDMGEEGLDLGKLYDYDAIVLDLNLPDMNGFDVLRKLRAAKVSTPVLILTGQLAIDSKEKGFKTGADDYLTKPFDLPELEARVRALVRRGKFGASPQIVHGRLRFDTVGRRVLVDDKPLDLSARELSMLETLLLNVGRVVSKDHLAEQVRGWGEEPGANAIEVYIHRLRKKLEPADVTVRTVRGLGYLLDKPSG